jgi:hypothetical protein
MNATIECEHPNMSLHCESHLLSHTDNHMSGMKWSSKAMWATKRIAFQLGTTKPGFDGPHRHIQKSLQATKHALSFFKMGQPRPLHKNDAYGHFYWLIAMYQVLQIMDCINSIRGSTNGKVEKMTATILQELILLCSRHLHWMYKSQATVSKWVHPESMSSLCSTGWR